MSMVTNISSFTIHNSPFTIDNCLVSNSLCVLAALREIQSFCTCARSLTLGCRWCIGGLPALLDGFICLWWLLTEIGCELFEQGVDLLRGEASQPFLRT